MNKKGQAAMEFLMTYGWAILVVIAAIAALAYFGVLDPARLLPERCQSSAGMDCIDKAAITTSGITIALRNNIGFGVTVTNINGTDCAGAATGAAGTSTALAALPVNISNNEVMRLNVACTLAQSTKYDDSLTVSYTNVETGLANKVLVDVRGRVA